MYYILASCCTVLFSGFCRLCFRLRAALLCWFSLSFTTSFGLHGYLQVCRIYIYIYIYIYLLEGFCFSAFFALFSFAFFHVITNTHKETTKITKENSTGKTQMETRRV
jgi:hypothetical protein